VPKFAGKKRREKSADGTGLLFYAEDLASEAWRQRHEKSISEGSRSMRSPDGDESLKKAQTVERERMAKEKRRAQDLKTLSGSRPIPSECRTVSPYITKTQEWA